MLSFDTFGHAITVNYKGQDKHRTCPGAFISIGIQVMVLIYLIMQTVDLIEMSEPTMITTKRPLYKEETDELGPVNLKDHNFAIGVAL